MSFVRNLKTVDSLKISGYRVLFFGLLGQWAAMSLQSVAQSLLLYRLTGSAVILGTMALANAIPQLVLSLFAGVLADRFIKKYILLITQGIAAFSIIIISVSLSSGYLSTENAGSWWVIVAAAVIQSVAMALMIPARQSFIAELVGKEKLMNAAAINTIGISLFQMTLPIAGGFIIDKIDFTGIYYVMSGLCLLTIIFTSFVPVIQLSTSIRKQNVIANISDGLKYTWRNPTILYIMVFTLVSMVLTSPQMTMMAIYADNILKVSATGMGVLQSISGISALVISVVLASLPSKKRGLLVIISSIISGLALMVFAFSTSMILSSAIMAITGLASTTNMLASMTLLQAYTDESYLGRVMSIQSLGMGLGSFGSFVSGILAERIGVQWTIGSFAMILTFVSILVLLSLPKMRQLE